MRHESVFEKGIIVRHRQILLTPADLIWKTETRVRFSEVDSMNIVWHGEYVKYFEDGREAFGRHYEGLGYMDFYKNGFVAPMVDLQIQFKAPLKCNDVAEIETRYINTESAKICFEYAIRRKGDNLLMAVGRSVQVFLDLKGNLELWCPKFYHEWKKKWGII